MLLVWGRKRVSKAREVSSLWNYYISREQLFMRISRFYESRIMGQPPPQAAQFGGVEA